MFGRLKLKTPAELRAMVPAGEATAALLAAARERLVVGATPLDLDAAADAVILAHGGRSNFRLVPGYRHALCVSVDDDVVHGIPGDRPFRPGDIVSVDGGAEIDGWNGDAAFTVVLPDPTRPDLVLAREQLAAAADRSLWAGIAALASARHLNEVGEAIEASIEASGDFGILEGYGGHGIGLSMHEDPSVYNHSVRGRGPRVRPGLVVAIEPMITSGGPATFVRDDGWTVATADGGDGAHVEHSVAVHADGIWVLTAPDGGAESLAPFGVRPVPIA
ncbi:type I methionyl aminopeptidase [Agromyces sp. SYSU T00266]|uniref:type I methionyl aminopeptidase n=1 Tax=Agromyces zhanjiangensis TaxID=3158562 RepID=UPI0033992730